MGKIKTLLNELWDASDQETEGVNAGHSMCLESSPVGLSCTRGEGHMGKHVALGTTKVRGIWGEPVAMDRNPEVRDVFEKLYNVIYAIQERRCSQRIGSYGCCRKLGHKGMHIAIGGDVIQAQRGESW